MQSHDYLAKSPPAMIRPEVEADREAVFALHANAFPTDAEARLVERLREAGHTLISLVA